MSNRGLDDPCPLAKVTAKAVAEVQESLTDLGQPPHLDLSRRVFNAADDTSRIRCLIQPGLYLLIKFKKMYLIKWKWSGKITMASIWNGRIVFTHPFTKNSQLIVI